MDIIADILDIARKGAGKTRIMYRCNLSHIRLQVYLSFLLKIGLLASIPAHGGNKLDSLKTTSKGLDFLEAYRALKALIP